MAHLLEFEPDRAVHPVDIIEHIAAINDWNFERQDTDEISISVRGSWSDYHVSFNWMQDLESLHIASAFDLKVPEARRPEVKALISSIKTLACASRPCCNAAWSARGTRSTWRPTAARHSPWV